MLQQPVDYLNSDWKRAVENVRAAAAEVWSVPAHRHAIDYGPGHADRVVGLLDGLSEGLRSCDDVRGGAVADAIVAGHLLALEVRVEDGGLVGASCGEGKGGLARPHRPEMTTAPDWNSGWSLPDVFTVCLLG